MESSFKPESKIQQIAEAYALDAIDFARDNFKLDLDWSDSSVKHIESMLEQFHAGFSTAKPTHEQIFQFAKLFGSYVGEVFRRNHGAEWGMVTLGGEKFPGLRANGTQATFWPWGRVQNRIVNGAEDNVWHYYQVLVARDGGGGETLTPPPKSGAAPKSWWSRLRRGA